MREVVRCSGENLASYTAKVRNGLWASAMEVETGLLATATAAYLRDGRGKMKLGAPDHKPKYIIELRDKHFYVKAMHIKKYCRAGQGL